MIEYLVLKPDGSVLQRGKCPAEQDIPQLEGYTTEVIDQEDSRQPNKPPEPTYVEYRAMDYPAIGEQLDVLWKAITSMGNVAQVPEVKAMLDRINAVKAKHPKITK